MENHSADQTIILSMKISCCKGCPKILKKKLLKMEGVESVTIDTEKNLVFVKGTIDSTTLLINVAKLGKKVQLQPTDEQNTKRHEDSTARKTRRAHKNCCCKDGRHASRKNKNVEEEHKCETYEYPKVEEKICRYCKIHIGEPILFKDNVPPEKTTPFYGGGYGGDSYSQASPFYSRAGPYGGSYGGDSYSQATKFYGGAGPYGGGYWNEPHPYGYAQQPRLGPHYPFRPTR